MKWIIVLVLCAVFVLAIGLTVSTLSNPGGKPMSSEKPVQTNQPAAVQNEYVEGELLAIVETKEQAEEIADLYGITLKSWNTTKVAVFVTSRDIYDVIAEGKEKGWPELSPNTIYHID